MAGHHVVPLYTIARMYNYNYVHNFLHVVTLVFLFSFSAANKALSSLPVATNANVPTVLDFSVFITI